MGCDWEAAYLDDEKLVLRQVRDKLLAPMTKQRTGTKANIRKNHFEIEDAWIWLRESQTAGKVK
jgi:hypothetical protein